LRSLAVLLCVAASVATATARADDVQECIAASDKGQVLRIDKHLRDASAQFALCARLQCPDQIREACVRWLDETRASIATIAFVLKDDRGADVSSVRLVVDDSPAATPYDGSALPLDPGPHTFRFESAGYPAVVKQFRLTQGERDRRETIVFERSSAAREASVSSPRAPAPTSPDGLRLAGYVAGSVGLAGIAAGTALGVAAVVRNNEAHCDAASVCQDPQARRNAQGIADASTVAFVAGSALLAAGVALLLVAPSGDASRRARLHVVPAVSRDAAGLGLGGSW
jgi:hypothetical protein